jgi:hypothetical protein
VSIPTLRIRAQALLHCVDIKHRPATFQPALECFSAGLYSQATSRRASRSTVTVLLIALYKHEGAFGSEETPLHGLEYQLKWFCFRASEFGKKDILMR